MREHEMNAQISQARWDAQAAFPIQVEVVILGMCSFGFCVRELSHHSDMFKCGAWAAFLLGEDVSVSLHDSSY